MAKKTLKFLCHCDGVNNGSVFIDELGHPAYVVGSPVTKTAIKKFGTASIHFPGGSYINFGNYDSFNLGANSFKLTFWLYIVGSSSGQSIISRRPSGVARGWCVYVGDANKLWLAGNFGGGWYNPFLASANAFTPDTLHYVEIGRQGDNWVMSIDGHIEATATLAGVADDDPSGFTLGSSSQSGEGTLNDGYLDEVSLEVGDFPHFEDFTPPDRPFVLDAYASQYPLMQTGDYVKATTTYAHPAFEPYFITDPLKSLVGSADASVTWYAAGGTVTNQRFHIDLGTAKIIKRIHYENFHHFGGNLDSGIQNFTLWGSNDASAFSDLTYGDDTNWTQIPTNRPAFEQHVAFDIPDPKYITAQNNVAYRYYAFKFADTWGNATLMGFRRLVLQSLAPDYEPLYPPVIDASSVIAASTYSAYYPYTAVDPATSLIGGWAGWISDLATNTNQRFHIDLGSAQIAKRIYYENAHQYAIDSNVGVKNFTVWGSNNAGAFAELTYGIDTNWTQIPTDVSEFAEHVAADVPDPHYVLLTNAVAYRYYAIKIADNWGAAYMGIRHIEIQTIENPSLSQYPPAQTGTYVKATNSAYAYGGNPEYATDPTKPLTGSQVGNGWSAYPDSVNMRFHIDLGEAKIIDRFYYENMHISGTTLEGAKNFTLWGTNNPNRFNDLVYDNDRPNVFVGGTPYDDDTHYDPTFQPPKAVDGNTGTRWSNGGSGPRPHWWAYDLGVGNEKTVTEVRIWGNPGDIATWQIQGSNDNFSTFDILYDSTEYIPAGMWTNYKFPNTTAYRYYRFYVNEPPVSNYCSIYEIQAFEDGWVQLTTNETAFNQHVPYDVEDPNFILVEVPEPFRYYALKIADCYPNYISFRRIELQSSSSIPFVTIQEDILSDAKIKYFNVQQDILSDTTIVNDRVQEDILSDAKIKKLNVQQDINSDTKIKVLGVQQPILSDATVVIQHQVDIFSDAKIKKLGVQQLIFSNTKIKVTGRQGNIFSDARAVKYYPQYPPVQNLTYVQATTYFPGYSPYDTTNPANSLVGPENGNQWYSDSPNNTDQRFHIDLGSAKVILRLYYENAHNSGGDTTYGVRNFTIWGSNDPNAFADLVYNHDTGWTQLTTDKTELDEHVASDVPDPKYIKIFNDNAYRYYAFKFADNWGASLTMAVRRLVLETDSQIQNIFSDAKIKVLNRQQPIDSNAKVVTRHQGDIFSDTRIKVPATRKYILSDTRIKLFSKVFYGCASLIKNSVQTFYGRTTVVQVTSTVPTGLKARDLVKGDSILLAWNADANYGYNVYQTNPGPRTKVNTYPIIGVNEYQVGNLTTGTAYSFIVVGVNGIGDESADSNTATATPTFPNYSGLASRFQNYTYSVKINNVVRKDAFLSTVELGYGTSPAVARFMISADPATPGLPVNNNAVEVIVNNRSIFKGTIKNIEKSISSSGMAVTYIAYSRALSYMQESVSWDYVLQYRKLYNLDVADQTYLQAQETIANFLGNYRIYYNMNTDVIEQYKLGTGFWNRTVTIGKNVIDWNITYDTTSQVNKITVRGDRQKYTTAWKDVVWKYRYAWTSYDHGRLVAWQGFWYFEIDAFNIGDVQVEALQSLGPPTFEFDPELSAVPADLGKTHWDDDTIDSKQKVISYRNPVEEWQSLGVKIDYVYQRIGNEDVPVKAIVTKTSFPKVLRAHIQSVGTAVRPGRIPAEDVRWYMGMIQLQDYEYDASNRVSYSYSIETPATTPVGMGTPSRTVTDTQYKPFNDKLNNEDDTAYVYSKMAERALGELEKVNRPVVSGRIQILGDETFDLKTLVDVEGQKLDVIRVVHNFGSGFTTDIELTNERFRVNIPPYQEMRRSIAYQRQITGTQVLLDAYARKQQQMIDTRYTEQQKSGYIPPNPYSVYGD